jgi:hypothetical protein
LKSVSSLKGAKGVLIGTKVDEPHRRKVAKDEAQQYAKANNLMYFETSAVVIADLEEQSQCRSSLLLFSTHIQ